MNLIENIEIKNFKSIRHQKIEGCKRVNVFVGYPNVGKSNILEALGIFSSFQLKNQSFKFNEICRVHFFSELFFNRDTREAVNICVNNNILTELIVTEANDLNVRMHGKVKGNNERDHTYDMFSTTIVNNDFSYKISKEPIDATDEQIMPSVHKYEFDKNIIINQQKPKALAIPYGNNLADVLHSHADLRKEIVSIFKDYDLKLVLSREAEESIRFQKELEDGVVVPIEYHQIADTLRRLIFFKAAIVTNSDAVLLFEEPEAHMFPPYISKFTSDIIFDENNNQYFISTHSPFVLNDFMEELSPDDLNIYTVTLKNGETIIRKMTNEEISEIYQYGIDLFFNLEDYLKDEIS